MELYPKQYLYRRVVRAKLYIDAQFADPIDLSDISDEACFSKFHFMRLFKEIYGRTPHQYLTYVRIEKAKEYLAARRYGSKGLLLGRVRQHQLVYRAVQAARGATPAAYQAEKLRVKEEIVERPLIHIPGCFAEKKGWKKNSNFGEVESIDPARAHGE